jgi:hypothetical protein
MGCHYALLAPFIIDSFDFLDSVGHSQRGFQAIGGAGTYGPDPFLPSLLLPA